MSETCDSSDIEDIFPDPNPKKKYRYFNQPIEQIPGYEESQPQILVHGTSCGLQWFTLDQCLPVVTCIKLESEELVIERKRLVVIKDFDIPADESGDCENIPVTECDESGEAAALGSVNNYNYDKTNKKWVSSNINSSCSDPTTELES